MRVKRTEVAIGVVVQNGNILLTQRFSPTKPSIHLKWQLPGGAIEKGETCQDACIREVFEETGFKIKLISQTPFEVVNTFENNIYVLKGFRAEVESGTIDSEKDEETNDIKWYKLNDIYGLKTLENTVELIKGCLKN